MQAFIEKYIRQGHREGYREGAARALLRQIQAKFGPLEPAVEARIQRAEPAQLERWLERILEAATLEAVFAEG